MLNNRFTSNVLKTVQVMPLYNNMFICLSGCFAQGPLSLKFSLLFLWHIITKHMAPQNLQYNPVGNIPKWTNEAQHNERQSKRY